MLQPYQFQQLCAQYPTAVQWEGMHDRVLDFLRITDRRGLAKFSSHFIRETNTWLVDVHFDNNPYFVGYLVEVSATDVAFYDGPLFTNELTPEQKLDTVSTYQRNVVH